MECGSVGHHRVLNFGIPAPVSGWAEAYNIYRTTTAVMKHTSTSLVWYYWYLVLKLTDCTYEYY